MKIVALNALTKEDGEEQEEASTQVSKEAQVGVKFSLIFEKLLICQFFRKQLQFQSIYVLYR